MRIGVIGTGEWARKVHLPALAAAESVDLVGVWGRNTLAASTVASQLGIEAFSDALALIDAVDAVSIVLPPHAQADYAEAAARAGRHLLLEKPIASDPAVARRLVGTVDAEDVRAVVFVTRFFDPQQRAWLDELVKQQPDRAFVSWRSGAMLAGSSYAGGWRDDADALLDIGPHVISQFEYVLGPIIAARTVRGAAKGESEYHFEHTSGATSSAVLDLHTTLSDEEFYEFGTASQATQRGVHLDFGASLTAAVDRLRAEIVHRPTGAEPWSIAAGLHAVDVIDGLRRDGAWAADDRAS